MIHCKKHFLAVGLSCLLPLSGWSAAPVVDESDNFAVIEGQEFNAPVASKYDNNYNDDYEAPLAKEETQNRSGSMSSQAALIDKIQNLQREVQELRGQLEVQANDLKRLQQQQTTLYKDIDTRLGSNNAPTKVSSQSSMDLDVGTLATAPTASETSNLSRVNPADEQISYLAAYELIKGKRYEEAIASMSNFAQKYPQGTYTANAHYWLGELHLLKKNNQQAITHFNTVLQQFPTSSKSAASMLKVGYAYAAMGNKQEARRFLQQVERAYPNTPTAQLASTKLRTI